MKSSVVNAITVRSNQIETEAFKFNGTQEEIAYLTVIYPGEFGAVKGDDERTLVGGMLAVKDPHGEWIGARKGDWVARLDKGWRVVDDSLMAFLFNSRKVQ